MLCVNDAEQQRVLDWLQTYFASAMTGAVPGQLPFSFRYAGAQPGADWQAAWVAGEALPREERFTLTLTHGESGLRCRCEVTRFLDFPALEWVAYFENVGTEDTEILSDILPLDGVFAAVAGQSQRVHYAKGSDCRRDDFTPLMTPLGATAEEPQAPPVIAGNPLCLQSYGGRSSCITLPFFNVQTGDQQGVMVAVGWTGDWAARIWQQGGDTVHIQAGMPRTHLRLHPGESIRTPRIMLLCWEGERLRGHNLLRRFILAHHTPVRNGEPLRAPISFAVWGENRTERQLGKVRWFADNRIPIDNFWIDAGWHGDVAYKDSATVFNSEWWRHVGNWWPNATAYPDGLRPIGEAVQKAGFDFTLWFEPERVFTGTQFTQEHPEWLLGPVGDNYLLNLGDPAACQALTELISARITEGRLTCYRQDFNTESAPFWQAADAPDRIGMTEIKYIEGLYAFWDALLARHPALFIDNCSSGGRRIDLETISRSIPLWRSDFQCFPDFDVTGMQGQTHGLSLWVPLHTGACDRQDDYAFRSTLGPGMVLTTRVNDTNTPEGFLTPWESYSVEWLHTRLTEQQAVKPFFTGDFYPLLSFSLATDQWAAWQFDRPDLSAGILLAFRRPDSPFDRLHARLHALDRDAQYEVKDADSGEVRTYSGEELIEQGISVLINERPGSRLLYYTRVN